MGQFHDWTNMSLICSCLHCLTGHCASCDMSVNLIWTANHTFRLRTHAPQLVNYCDTKIIIAITVCRIDFVEVCRSLHCFQYLSLCFSHSLCLADLIWLFFPILFNRFQFKFSLNPLKVLFRHNDCLCVCVAATSGRAPNCKLLEFRYWMNFANT